MMKPSLALSLNIALVLAASMPNALNAQAPGTSTLTVSADGTAATVTVSGPGAPPSAASRVIVRFRAGMNFLPGSGRSVGLSAARNVRLVDNPPGLSVDQTIARYRTSPNVYAEPDYTVRAILAPTDPNGRSSR